MYCCVFWCEFIDLVVFCGIYCVTLVTLFTGKKTDTDSLVRKEYISVTHV